MPDTLKKCSRCRELKPETTEFFHRHKTIRFQNWCKVCTKVDLKEWRSENRTRYRRTNRKHNFKNDYGIILSEEDLDRAELATECEACGSKSPGVGNKAWSLDHCHISKRVRGVLCHQCNVALGYVGDSTARLQQLISYLEKYKAEPNGKAA